MWQLQQQVDNILLYLYDILINYICEFIHFLISSKPIQSTGVGEYLIKTIFAKKCASKLLKANRQSDQFDSLAFDDVIRNTFVNDLLSKWWNLTCV